MKQEFPPHHWTQAEEDLVVDLHEAGWRIFEIARQVEMRYKVVETKIQHMRRAGKARRAHRPWPEEAKDELRQLMALGHTAPQIAQIMDRTVHSVRTKMGVLRYTCGNEFSESNKANIMANIRFVSLALEHHPEKETAFK